MTWAESWFTLFGRIGVMPEPVRNGEKSCRALKRQMKVSDSISLAIP